jgi:hypothetical protein
LVCAVVVVVVVVGVVVADAVRKAVAVRARRGLCQPGRRGRSLHPGGGGEPHLHRAPTKGQGPPLWG